MKRNLKIICIFVIIILINAKTFAETTKFKVNEKIDEIFYLEKFDEKTSYFINSDTDIREFHQVWNKLDKSININESNEILNNKIKIEIINILDKEVLTSEVDTLEECDNCFDSRDEDIYIFEWDGKDRQISLDLDEEDCQYSYL